jgi:hypothetical protein
MIRWTLDSMPALTGRTVLVTGANTGLGYETALASAGKGATVVIACRTPSSTELGRHFDSNPVFKLLRPLLERMLQTPAMGALPTLRAMTEPGVTGGEYFGPSGFQQQRGYPVLVGSHPASQDPELAAGLWEASERLTGASWPAA